MLADNSIRFQPVKVKKNKILRHKLLNNLPQKYKFSVHPICTVLKKPPVFTDGSPIRDIILTTLYLLTTMLS